MKILLLDIETSPNTAYVWGLFQQNVAITQIKDTSKVLCYSYKWYGDKNVVWARGENLETIHKRLDEADVVVHYYGKRFDIPVLNRAFVKAGMPPPSPIKQIDLKEVVKNNFKFASNKLDHVAQELGLGKKEDTDFQLWVDCMNDVPEAWEKMESYNIQDVLLLEKLYDRLMPWIKNHPNHGLYNGGQPVCPNCGKHHVQKRGFAFAQALKYQRYQCQSCGNWFRDKVALNLKEKPVYANIV